MTILQLAFLPEEERSAPKVKATYPVMIYQAGHYCWLVLGSAAKGAPEYKHEPELEALLLAKKERRAA